MVLKIRIWNWKGKSIFICMPLALILRFMEAFCIGKIGFFFLAKKNWLLDIAIQWTAEYYTFINNHTSKIAFIWKWDQNWIFFLFPAEVFLLQCYLWIQMSQMLYAILLRGAFANSQTKDKTKRKKENSKQKTQRVALNPKFYVRMHTEGEK